MSRNKKQKSLEEMIQNSGHNLHMRVAQMLRNKGLEVSISPTYRDDPTGIVREIDILAIYKGKTTIPFALCIECKYLTGPVAFYADKIDPKQLVSMMAKQFCDEEDVGADMLSSSEKFSELRRGTISRICVPDDQISEGNFQLIKSAIYFSERSINRAHRRYYYKWLIVDGDISRYNASTFEKDKPLEDIKKELNPTDHIFYAFNYSGENYLIEVFKESYLEKRINELKEADVAQINLTINGRSK